MTWIVIVIGLIGKLVIARDNDEYWDEDFDPDKNCEKEKIIADLKLNRQYNERCADKQSGMKLNMLDFGFDFGFDL